MTNNNESEGNALTKEFMQIIMARAEKKAEPLKEYASRGLLNALEIVRVHGHDDETRALIEAYQRIVLSK